MTDLIATTSIATTVNTTSSPAAPAASADTRAPRWKMSPARMTALIAGVAYLLTFVFSLPTLGMKAPLDNPLFVLGAGSSTSVSRSVPKSRSSSIQASNAPGTTAGSSPVPGTWWRPSCAKRASVAPAG